MTTSSQPGERSKVVIGILTYNAVDSLRRLLGEIAASDARTVPIIVADDGSTDGTAEYLASVGRGRSALHHGVARNRNRILHAAFGAGARYVMMLDDDAVILKADWLQHWIERARTADLVAYSAGHRRPGSEDWMPVSFHACLIPWRAWICVGDFDEAYDLGWGYEDSDYMARALAEAFTLSGEMYGICGGGTGRHNYLEDGGVNQRYFAGLEGRSKFFKPRLRNPDFYSIQVNSVEDQLYRSRCLLVF